MPASRSNLWAEKVDTKACDLALDTHSNPFLVPTYACGLALGVIVKLPMLLCRCGCMCVCVCTYVCS